MIIDIYIVANAVVAVVYRYYYVYLYVFYYHLVDDDVDLWSIHLNNMH